MSITVCYQIEFFHYFCINIKSLLTVYRHFHKTMELPFRYCSSNKNVFIENCSGHLSNHLRALTKNTKHSLLLKSKKIKEPDNFSFDEVFCHGSNEI